MVKKQKQSRDSSIFRRVKLLCYPHKANGYHPHIIRGYSFLGISIALLVFSSISSPVMGLASVNQDAITPETLLTQTNDVRQKGGLNALAMNNKLAQAAQNKADDMMKYHYWSHTSPGGVQPWQWIHDTEYSYSYAGENLARGYASSGAVLNAWMQSPEHKANILDSHYKEVGFAVVNGRMNGASTTLVVAYYAAPQSTAIAGGHTEVFTTAQSTNGLIGTVRSFPVAALASLGVLTVLIGVCVLTYARRHKHSHRSKKRVYLHHGIAKAGGFISIGVIIVVMYSGGQI